MYILQLFDHKSTTDGNSAMCNQDLYRRYMSSWHQYIYVDSERPVPRFSHANPPFCALPPVLLRKTDGVRMIYSKHLVRNLYARQLLYCQAIAWLA